MLLSTLIAILASSPSPAQMPPIDLPGLSYQFSLYASQTSARAALAAALPIGTPTDEAAARLKLSGALCRRSPRKPDRISCHYLTSESTGDGAITTVLWQIELTDRDGLLDAIRLDVS